MNSTRLRSSSSMMVKLHCLAGLILFLFAISHVAFLGVLDATHDLKNTVFPFLTNRYVYLVAGSVEASIGLQCLRLRGGELPNFLVLTFVAVICWYRWAFSYTGGEYCGCLGLLGRLLGLTKTQEKIVPIIALCLLFASTIPWLWRRITRLANSDSRGLLFFVTFLMSSGITEAHGGVRIHGTITLQDRNPSTGIPYTNQYSRSTFDGLIGETKWILTVTNIDRPRWSATYVYDGTNSYIITPFEGSLVLPFGSAGNNKESTDAPVQQVTIEPSPRFIIHSTENVGLSMVWLTYGLNPALFHTNLAGLVELPMPAASARENLAAFGYKWVMSSGPASRFLESCEIIRDHSLDLGNDEEIFRAELDYPETLPQYNQYLLNLSNRRETPSGFMRARYRCTSWFTTNATMVPKDSKYEVYLSPGSKYSWRVIELKLLRAELFEPGQSLTLPEITTQTRVRDYRYKGATESRIFKYAEYTLENGDSWKSVSDPILLAQRAQWLENGRKFTHFEKRGRVWASWVILGLIGVPLLTSIWFRRRANRTEKQKT